VGLSLAFSLQRYVFCFQLLHINSKWSRWLTEKEKEKEKEKKSNV
jgi:hypothetical protein